MKGNTSVSGKKTVEESAMELNRIWVGEVFQDDLIKDGNWYKYAYLLKNLESQKFLRKT